MDTEERPDVSADELEKQFQQPAHTDSAHTDPDSGSHRGFGTISRNDVANKIAGRATPNARTKPSAGRITGASYPVGPLGGGDKGGGLAGGAAGSVKDKALGAAAGAAAEAAGIPAPIAKSFLNKNGLKILGGAVALVILVIVLIIAFFLSLFKLKDIEKMFLSYEFASANHTLAERTSEIMAENKANDIAKGNADTAPADSNAPLEEQLSKANSDQLSQAEADPATETNYIRQTETLNFTPDGVTGEVLPAYGVSESSEPRASDSDPKTQEETNSDVAKAEATQVTTAESGAGVPADPAIEEGAKKAQDEFASGKSADGALTDGANANPETVLGFPKAASGFLFASVIYCIAYNIFHTAAQKLTGVVANGLMQFSTSVNVAAEGQTVNAYSAKQIGAYNNLFDSTDGTGASGTQAAAYSRANHQAPDTTKDLSSDSRPFNKAGDPTFLGQLIAHAADIPVLGPVSDKVCPVIVNPYVQGGLLGLQAAFLISGFLDGGASDAADAAATEATAIAVREVIVKAVLTTGITIAGTDALRTLVKHEIARYTGLGVAATNDHVQNMNKVDAGDSLLATEAYKHTGAHQLPDQQATTLTKTAFAEQAAQLSRQSLAYRIFSPTNPYSMTAKVLMQLPSSPQAMVAHVSNFFAGLFNPAHLFATLGSLAPGSIANADASALACPGAAYGIPCYGLPDSQVSQWTFRDNSKWVESRGLDSFKKYDKCFTTKLTDTINDPDFAPTKPDGSGGGMCNNQGDVNLQHYQMYLLDKHIVQNMVNYGNNTSKTGGTTAPTTPASGDAKQLASQILSNPKINTSGRLVVQDLQATASGLPGTSNAPISATLLGLIQTIGQNHTFTITAIESGGTGHCNNTPKPACPTDPHYTGDAFDLSGVDGVATTGRDTASLAVIADMVPLMPSGSGFGQAGCPGGTPSLPATITTFADTCTHLHVQVPAGAP